MADGNLNFSPCVTAKLDDTNGNGCNSSQNLNALEAIRVLTQSCTRKTTSEPSTRLRGPLAYQLSKTADTKYKSSLRKTTSRKFKHLSFSTNLSEIISNEGGLENSPQDYFKEVVSDDESEDRPSEIELKLKSLTDANTEWNKCNENLRIDNVKTDVLSLALKDASRATDKNRASDSSEESLNGNYIEMDQNSRSELLRRGDSVPKANPEPSWRASLRAANAKCGSMGDKPLTAAKPWVRSTTLPSSKPSVVETETKSECSASTIRLVSKRFEAVELKSSSNDHSTANEDFYEKYGVIKVTRDGNDNQNACVEVIDEPKPDIPRSYRLVNKAPVKLVMPDSLDQTWTTMMLRSETLGGEQKIVPAITEAEAAELARIAAEEEESTESSSEEEVKKRPAPPPPAPAVVYLESSADPHPDSDGVNNNRYDLMSSSMVEMEPTGLVNPFEFSMLSAEAPEFGLRTFEKKKKKGGKEFFKRLLRRGGGEEKATQSVERSALPTTWSDPGLLDDETCSEDGSLDEIAAGRKNTSSSSFKKSDMNGRPLPSVDGSWMDDVLKVLNIDKEGDESEESHAAPEKRVEFMIGEHGYNDDAPSTPDSVGSASPSLSKKLRKPRRRSDVSGSPNKIFDALRNAGFPSSLGRKSVVDDPRARTGEGSDTGKTRGLTALDLVDIHVKKQAEMNADGDRKFQTLPTRAAMKKRAKLELITDIPITVGENLSPTSGRPKPLTHPIKPAHPPPPIPEEFASSRDNFGTEGDRKTIQRPMSTVEASRMKDQPPPVPVTSRPHHRPERPPPPRLFRASTSDMPHPPTAHNGRSTEPSSFHLPVYEMYGTRGANSTRNTYDYIASEQMPNEPPQGSQSVKLPKKSSRFSRANIKKSFSLSDRQRKLPFLPKSKKSQKIYEEIPGQRLMNNKPCSPDQYEDLDDDNNGTQDDDDDLDDENEENIYDPIDSPPVPDFDPTLSSPTDGCVRPEDYLIPTLAEERIAKQPPPTRKLPSKPGQNGKPNLLHKALLSGKSRGKKAREDSDSLCSVSSAEEYVEISEEQSSGNSMDPLIALNQATLATLGVISQMNMDTLRKAVLDHERSQKHVIVGAAQRFLEYELKSEVPLVQNSDTRFYKAIVKRNRQQCVVLLTHGYIPEVLLSPKCPNGIRQTLAFEDFVSTRLLAPLVETPVKPAERSRPAPAITRGKISVLKYNDLMSLDKFLDIVSANKDENYFCNVAFILIQILFLGAHLLQNGKLFKDLSLSGIIVVPTCEGTHVQVFIDPSFIQDEGQESGLDTLCSQLLSLIKITLVDEKAEAGTEVSTDVYKRTRALLGAVLRSNHPNNLMKCVEVLGFILWGPFGDAADMINSSSLEMECQNWLDTEYAKDVNRLARGETIDSTWTYFKLKYLCQMEGGATVANVIRSLKDCLEPP